MTKPSELIPVNEAHALSQATLQGVIDVDGLRRLKAVLERREGNASSA